MKKSYKRLLIFEMIVILVLMLNSFVSSILNNYNIVLFLLILIISFKFLFGFEKDRHRYTKDIIFDLIIFLLTFFLLFYLSGMVFSFARTANYWNIKDIVNIIIPIILSIILKEFLRYQVLTKSEGNKLLIIVTTIMFAFLDITTTLFYIQRQELYDVFLFVALNILPSISTNIVCTYVAIHVGYKPMIVFRLVMELYLYLLPIVPNPNPYIISLIRLLLPIIFGYRTYLFFQKEHDEDVERKKEKFKIVSLLLPTIIIGFLVYITCGYFHYQAVAIASGSMTPIIRKGDVVIIEKVDKNYEEIKEGQVIAYKYNNIIIVHRLVKKLKIGNQYYFYTKGDANESIDNYQITEDMIVGIVNLKVPYIGLPTVWLNEL